MIKKTAATAITALLALTLCACGSSGGTQVASNGNASEEAASTSSSSSETQTAEYDPMVDNIDLSLDGGSIRYDHFEKADAELTDADNALVFVFDFTNAQNTPAQCQSVFRIQFFQNGSELNGNHSYSSAGGDQYELVGAFFNDAMKGGTVTFGQIVVPSDDSPITIMVSPEGATLEDNYQTMEVAISGADGSDSSSVGALASTSTDEIDSALQGTWQTEGAEKGLFTFEQGSLSVSGSGAIMSGSYEIDTDSMTVIGHLETSDGTVKIELPYEYDGSVLKVFNNRGAEMTRM